jgi:hypothetical protein
MFMLKSEEKVIDFYFYNIEFTYIYLITFIYFSGMFWHIQTVIETV